MSVNEDPSTWSLQTVGGIPIKLKEGSTCTVEEENASVTEIYLIEASKFRAFCEESFPVPYLAAGGMFYPRRRYLPGLESLVTRRISAKGFPDGKPVDFFQAYPTAPPGTYVDIVEVTVEYGTTPENDQERDPNDPWTFLEISSRGAGEFLTAQTRNAEWEGVGGAANETVKEFGIPATVTESLVEHSAKWSQIPYAWFFGTMYPRLRGLMGKVNEEPMSLFADAPIDTIMLLGYEMVQQFTWRTGSVGSAPVQLTLNFLEKDFEGPGPAAAPVSVTHQHVYRPGHGWMRLLINSQYMYVRGDLNSLFDP